MKPKQRRKCVNLNAQILDNSIGWINIDYGNDDKMIRWIGDNAFDDNLPECCKSCTNVKNMMSYGCNCTLPLYEQNKKGWWENVY